ncbi:hypothetical protein C9374_006816 [Naegleria lovaniensis]|uniref:Uncharacterized protein n=1 Tax=Naegleria lovaniensis TaxID=51637 RepID=A0AA88H205_NAELO|nr:uncharacterized protein C9374_006816 [Naegleria lovaniensis]KAG2393285.1 hypothetical protein C9374_006816 [Naegleria lovaniensis]
MSEIDEEEDFDLEEIEEEETDEEENDEEFIETDSEEEEGKVTDHHELSEQEEDERDFPNFFDGLTPQGRLQVKHARKLYFDEKQREYNAMVAKEVSSKVKQRWNDIASNEQLASTGFDFQVLKNILDSQLSTTGETSTTATSRQTQQSLEEQLDIKQRGDHWDYTIGLNEVNHNNTEENTQDNETNDEEEEDNEEDEEITDDDDED